VLSPDCVGQELRLGLHCRHAFISGPYREAAWLPWLGIGVGMERTSLEVLLQRADEDGNLLMVAYRLDFVSPLVQLEAGVDLRLNDWLGIGPVLTIAGGRYASAGAVGVGEGGGLHVAPTFGTRLQMRPPQED